MNPILIKKYLMEEVVVVDVEVGTNSIFNIITGCPITGDRHVALKNRGVLYRRYI